MKRTWWAAALLLLPAALAGGCGIRATTVPVDVGAAPSRVSCDKPARNTSGAADGLRATVEMVCGSQLVGIERVVHLSEKRPVRATRVPVAQALLAELERPLSAAERDAGFTTGVPDGLSVTAPRAGDPAGTLRLSRKPEDLPPLALAQIVCTLAGTPLTGGPGPVVLGGPDADPPRAWECTAAVRARPEAVPTLGEIVRPTPSPGASRRP
ncbi:hypothetical protein LG634_28020 [Streptomyces bambusae]|uniref:hypothetical protein n=1 Tax=Streptomyces bambusae TaxID=1550616 RepID=UPI001CFD0B2D|nr:hypothetical protein [Streptomyces bambusae]MCB5168655.1 hypothetical protein [Streptomyces bambusae]